MYVLLRRPSRTRNIYKMTQFSYKELLLAGVKIYQYTPGFIHSKTLLMDGKLASWDPSLWITGASITTLSVELSCMTARP